MFHSARRDIDFLWLNFVYMFIGSFVFYFSSFTIFFTSMLLRFVMLFKQGF